MKTKIIFIVIWLVIMIAFWIIAIWHVEFQNGWHKAIFIVLAIFNVTSYLNDAIKTFKESMGI